MQSHSFGFWTVIAWPLLLCITTPCVHARARVYTTCDALELGFESSVVSSTSTVIGPFCRSIGDVTFEDYYDEAFINSIIVDGSTTLSEDVLAAESDTTTCGALWLNEVLARRRGGYDIVV